MDLKDCKNKKSQWIDTFYLSQQTSDMVSNESEARLGLWEMRIQRPHSFLFPLLYPGCPLLILKGPESPTKRAGTQPSPLGSLNSSLQDASEEESSPQAFLKWIHVHQMWANTRKYPSRWGKIILPVILWICTWSQQILYPENTVYRLIKSMCWSVHI